MNWKTIRRETSLVEHVCDEHGVGHPNFYSVYRLWNKYDDDIAFEASSWWIHGCCGCCGREDFPGHRMSNLGLLNRLMNYINEYADDMLEHQDMWNWIAYTIHDVGVNKELELALV